MGCLVRSYSLLFLVFINQVTQLIRTMEQWIMKRSAVEILFATIGLIIGLLIAVMASFILEMIGNSIFNHFIPIIITLILCYLDFNLV